MLSDSHVYFRAYDTLHNLYYEAMSSCRESVEWNYGQLKMLFKIFKSDLQIKCMKLMDMITVAFIFKNLFCCLNGNISSEYFDCMPPVLEDYLNKR